MASFNDMRMGKGILGKIGPSVGKNMDADGIASGASPAPSQPQGSADTPMVMDDAQSKLLRDQNYEALTDSLLTNYNMRMNSQKYLRNALAAQGLNANGYGNTASIGINTTAMNNANAALQNYYSQESQITADLTARNEQKAQESDNQLAQFIINYGNGDLDKIHSFLENYGYWDRDANDYSQAFKSLDSARQSYLKGLVEAAASQTQATPGSDIKYGDGKLSDWLTNNTVPGYDYESLRKSKWGVGQGATNTLDDGANGVANELNVMQAGIEGGQYKNGDVFKLTNNKGGWETYVLYYGGKYWRVNKEFYDSYRGGSHWSIRDGHDTVKE